MATVRGGIKVKPHVQKCADALVEEFGPGLSPGTYNGHSPPEGPTQALDLFNPQTGAGWELQNRVADWLIRNQKRFGVRYVIKWNPNGRDLIWNIERAGEGWRAKATRDHRDHVHVTFYAVAAGGHEEPSQPTTRKRKTMEIAYIANGQDFVFSSSSRYHGVLPNGATLDGLKKKGALQNWGDMGDEFHAGMVDFATRAGFTRSYE